MTVALAFVFAAAGGALARASITGALNRPEGIPWGTLLVNVSGSFALGLASTLAPPALTVVALGAIGAFTTFSAFSVEVTRLVEQGQPRAAASYVVLSCGLSIAAAWAGMQLVI